MKPGQEASYPAVIQESLIWLKPKSKDATNTTSKDISSFLLRQYDLVEREPTQGLWSEADLVLKSGPITFFLNSVNSLGFNFVICENKKTSAVRGCCAGLGGTKVCASTQEETACGQYAACLCSLNCLLLGREQRFYHFTTSLCCVCR